MEFPRAQRSTRAVPIHQDFWDEYNISMALANFNGAGLERLQMLFCSHICVFCTQTAPLAQRNLHNTETLRSRPVSSSPSVSFSSVQEQPIHTRTDALKLRTHDLSTKALHAPQNNELPSPEYELGELTFKVPQVQNTSRVACCRVPEQFFAAAIRNYR